MEIQERMAAVMRTLIKQYRSMQEAADGLEISRSALQDYLSGRGNPTLSTLAHLARRLEVDPALLVSGTFTDRQLEVLLSLLDSLGLLSELEPAERRRFAGLLLEMVGLWKEGEGLA